MPATYNYEYFNVTFPEQYVAHVEINRPEKMNAFIEIMWLNLEQIIKKLSRDSDVRAIVLTGAGDRAYTAGLDVQAASQGTIGGKGKVADVAREMNKVRQHVLEFQDCITALERCDKPIITALHGYSFGLAIDMSVTCDIRVCSADTRFSVKEVDIGIAADIGTLTRLPKAVGNQSWVKEVCLTARIWSAEEALRVGYVSHIFPDKAAAVKGAFGIAKLIAEKSPVATLGTKNIINFSKDRRVEDGLIYTAVWNGGMIQTKDTKDALLSGLQKRKPTFEKL
ncbi:ClpP/crotonase [Eremomyces bilateralis CBS 781.70]|uniref:ClpP/crotonase n=1 Tax=Eremomyces bilateralis CBS 781.70 TaxID=1392243 RepID=A0A6G1G2S9_9PEZI|nr:ClpP/crotonase [Eremomyces bilateralis CBS 781.70]KAF1812415.1 ClpP/crotonase [Eremomyces bilateralis CBS 781.70]